MSSSIDLVEGWSGPVDQYLDADGAPIDGTGLGIALELRRADGTLVDTAGKVEWVAPATQGLVRWTPAAVDLVAGVHRGRFQVVDGLGRAVYWPSGPGEGPPWTVIVWRRTSAP